MFLHGDDTKLSNLNTNVVDCENVQKMPDVVDCGNVQKMSDCRMRDATYYGKVEVVDCGKN
jgi:hypothetical protein